ncbi:MAG TPA: DUF2948 family protein [Geminicoccaceae bacterium]
MRPSGDTTRERLRLRAVDDEDLHVMAACLQDALTCISEMAYLRTEDRFMAAFLRFRRECQKDTGEPGALLQCQCALTFDEVEAVRYRGIDPRFGRVRLELLTIIDEPDPEGGGARINLLFAGDAAIQLKVRKIEVRLEDFGECAPATAVPVHPVVAQSDA